jgi:hypothetical protein
MQQISPPSAELQNTQLVFHCSHAQFLTNSLCCMCEKEIAIVQPNRRIDMDRLLRNALGLAVALGTSGLMFAVTLA